MKKPRILIADDHILVQEGLNKLLKTHFELAGTARNGRELIAIARRLKPDIILLDISMPELNGFEAAKRLRRSVPDARLIFLTMHDEADYVAEALRFGASGYILKRSTASELIEAIQKVYSGGSYITPLVKIFSESLSLKRKAADILTSRQREVLQLIAEGKCPKEISSRLGISVRTVEFHKYSIMRRLGLNTIAELTRYAVRQRLI